VKHIAGAGWRGAGKQLTDEGWKEVTYCVVDTMWDTSAIVDEVVVEALTQEATCDKTYTCTL